MKKPDWLLFKKDNGWEDSDGLYWDSAAEFIACTLGACGCCSLEVIVETERMLRICGGLYESNTGRFFNENHTNQWYMAASLLDRAGLIEHGSSIRGSFRTADGERVLAMLRWERAVAFLNQN